MTVNPYEIIGDCEQSTARVAGIGFPYKTNRSLLTLPLSNLVLRWIILQFMSVDIVFNYVVC